MTAKTATEWVDAAIDVGLDPYLLTQPDGSQGIFQKVVASDKSPGPVPEDLIDDICDELIARGRVQIHCADPA